MSRKPVDYYTDQYGTHPIFEGGEGGGGGELVTGQDIEPNSVTTNLTDTVDLNVSNTTTVNDLNATDIETENLVVTGSYSIDFPERLKVRKLGSMLYTTNGVLMEDGSIITWGQNMGTYGGAIRGANNATHYIRPGAVPIPHGETGNVVDADLYAHGGCILFDTGNFYTAGNNPYGTCATGDTVDQPTWYLAATDVVEYRAPKALSYEHNTHRLFIKKTDGFWYVTGASGYGATATGVDSNYLNFTVLPFNANEIEELWNFGATWGHTFIKKTDGTLIGSGFNGFGEMGIGSTSTFLHNEDITSYWLNAGETLIDIHAESGYYDSSARSESNVFMLIEDSNGDRYVRVAGSNTWSAIGDGTTTHRYTPVTNTYLPTNIKSINVCGGGPCVVHILMDDGDVWSWGYHGDTGALGDGTSTTTRSIPIKTATNMKEVFCRTWAHTYPYRISVFATDNDGQLWGTGHNNQYELGLGHTNAVTTWTEIPFDHIHFGEVVDVACSGYNGDFYYLFLTSKGALFATGYNGRYGVSMNGETYQGIMHQQLPIGTHAGPQGLQGNKGDTGPAGVLESNSAITVGSPSNPPVEGDKRTYLTEDKVTTQEYIGGEWVDVTGLNNGTIVGITKPRGILHVQHSVAPGVQSGSVTGGSWNIGPLNTLKKNTVDGAALDPVNNTFTLPAGKYRLQGFRAIFYCDAYAMRLWNITDNKTELIGMNGYTDNAAGYNSEHVPFQGIIEIDAPKVFRVEAFPQISRANDGWGYNTNTYGGEDRVWADFLIEDIQELTGPEGKPGTIESNSGFYVGNTDTPTSGDKRVEVTNSKIGVQEWDGSQWVDRVGFNNDTMIGTAATDIPTLHIRHQVGASEDSGAIPTATWTTRPFNVEQWNTIPNSDLDTQNGYFFLPAGSYVIEAQLEAFRVDDFTSRLYNNTTGEVVLIGTKGYTEQAGGYANDQSYVRGAFNLSQDSWLQLQMYTSNSQAGANQMGRGSSDLDGQASVHAEAIIQTRTALKGDKGDTGLITDNEGAIISGNTIIESSGNLTVDGGDLNVNGTFNMQGSRYPMIWVQPANPTVSDGEDGDLWFVI
jgi:alpha-tubulin suppressor-like RCC1 family protein